MEKPDTKQIAQTMTGLIFQVFNDLFCADMFETANDALGYLIDLIEILDIFAIRSILTITYAAKDKLPNRIEFHEKASQRFIALKDGNVKAIKDMENLK